MVDDQEVGMPHKAISPNNQPSQMMMGQVKPSFQIYPKPFQKFTTKFKTNYLTEFSWLTDWLPDAFRQAYLDKG